MDIEEQAKKEIDRIETIIKKVRIMKNEGMELFRMANAYYLDARHFFSKNSFLEAFEAAVITWAYIDAGLHFKFFSVPDEIKNMFTAE